MHDLGTRIKNVGDYTKSDVFHTVIMAEKIEDNMKKDEITAEQLSHL